MLLYNRCRDKIHVCKHVCPLTIQLLPSSLAFLQRTHKIEKINERSLRFIHKDYTSEYSDLLKSSNTTTLYLKRVRIIAQEVYKAVHDQSPKYVQELVRSRHSQYPSRHNNPDLYIPRVNQVKFGYRSYRYEAPS